MPSSEETPEPLVLDKTALSVNHQSLLNDVVVMPGPETVKPTLQPVAEHCRIRSTTDMAESNLYTSVMSTLYPLHAIVSVHESDGVSTQSVQKNATSPTIGPGP